MIMSARGVGLSRGAYGGGGFFWTWFCISKLSTYCHTQSDNEKAIGMGKEAVKMGTHYVSNLAAGDVVARLPAPHVERYGGGARVLGAEDRLRGKYKSR